MPPSGSLARRLLIGAGLWSLIVLFGGAFALTALYRSEAVRLLESDLEAELIALSRAVEVNEVGEIVAEEDKLPSDSRYATPLSGRYWAIIGLTSLGTNSGDIRSPSLWDSDPPLTPLQRARALSDPGTTIFDDAVTLDGERLRVGVRSAILGPDAPRVLLVAAADRTGSDAGAQRFLYSIILAMLFLAGGVLLAMAVQLRVVLEPLERIQGHLARIRAGDANRLEGIYPVEVRPLTEELNKLIDHNREVVERARTHVGNLAHALKTPIAVLRNEATGDSPLDEIVRRQTETMHQNVQHYLKRAQAAARAQLIGARAPVRPVADGLTRTLGRLYERDGIAVENKVPAGLVFRGESQDLEEMIGNLAENACKWASMTVEVSADPAEDGWMEIHVDDDGDGLSPDEREAAMRRGVRLDETAPGTGLGLSIVKELAELYMGQLTLSQSPMGGLRASLRLPAL